MSDDAERLIHRTPVPPDEPSTENLWVIGLVVLLVVLAGVLYPGIPLP